MERTNTLDPRIIHICREKLIHEKESILDRILQLRSEFKSRDTKGDEADLSANLLFEHQLLSTQDKLSRHLMEIENALARIERGDFGFCEITQEPIESQRLLALPWTRLSIEGAEYQDTLSKKFFSLSI